MLLRLKSIGTSNERLPAAPANLASLESHRRYWTSSNPRRGTVHRKCSAVFLIISFSRYSAVKIQCPANPFRAIQRWEDIAHINV
jgi:hypothetical protein